MSEQDDKRREVCKGIGIDYASSSYIFGLNIEKFIDCIIEQDAKITELKKLILFQHEMIQTAKPIARGSRTGQFMVAAHCKYFLENYTKYRQMIKKVLPPESEESDD